jgi:hypothetical protein
MSVSARQIGAPNRAPASDLPFVQHARWQRTAHAQERALAKLHFGTSEGVADDNYLEGRSE